MKPDANFVRSDLAFPHVELGCFDGEASFGHILIRGDKGEIDRSRDRRKDDEENEADQIGRGTLAGRPMKSETLGFFDLNRRGGRSRQSEHATHEPKEVGASNSAGAARRTLD